MLDLNQINNQVSNYREQYKGYKKNVVTNLNTYKKKYLEKYREGVYINNIRLDWCQISETQKGDMKDSPLDPSDIPNQISTNLRIGDKELRIEAKFNLDNLKKKELFEEIKQLFLKKQKINITTSNEIIENLVILSISKEMDKNNYSFSLSVRQFQTAKIMSTGEVKTGEQTQVNGTTTVGTQGTTPSKVSGGYLK
ncbi:MAG: hypothetical protein HXM48_00080 [Leptotrichia sp.]|jgi:hypothetical protein|nr:hypothetical protein [Leptotrichia sp.]DAF23911.1 MAG TPA: hypothetical protein [Caudoviricetes sp.]DAX94122.1 MAG TPA: hypothetical protein [Caudoviricetes sp.]